MPFSPNLALTTASTASFDAWGLMKTKARFTFVLASTVAASHDGALPMVAGRGRTRERGAISVNVISPSCTFEKT